jgi:single-strand DNA-binding protein
MFHKVTIIGNLGRDPELKYTPSGDPFVSFSVATNRKWTNQDGSQGEETIWFRCTAWRKTAETINQYLSKGRQVYIEGRLQPDKATGNPRVFTKNDGSTGASYEILVDTIKFLGGAGGRSGEAGESTGTGHEPPAVPGENEIPF